MKIISKLYLLFASIVVSSFVGCIGCDHETEQDVLKKINSPIVVVAIDEARRVSFGSGSITLSDSAGKLWSFRYDSDIARSISNSRKIGDTLR